MGGTCTGITKYCPTGGRRFAHATHLTSSSYLRTTFTPRTILRLDVVRACSSCCCGGLATSDRVTDSSRNATVVRMHMQAMYDSGISVAVVSWWGRPTMNGMALLNGRTPVMAVC